MSSIWAKTWQGQYRLVENVPALTPRSMSSLSLPPNHGIPRGTQILISHGEIVHFDDNSPDDSVYDSYCSPNPHATSLRHEPCHPHQTYGPGASVLA